ncbi:MAG: iron-sulfur cluster loop [Desulfurococcaceae archaeon]
MSWEVKLDTSKARSMGEVLKTTAFLKKMHLFNEDFYPPKEADVEIVGMYFMALVSIDHRLSRPGRPYEDLLHGKLYHGSDLLYRLAMAKFSEDPEFFSPQRLSLITLSDFCKVFNTNKAKVPDPEVRTALLRDLGYKIVRLYNSSFNEFLKASNERIRGTLSKPGIVDNLRVFRAYEDPVEKKSFLLVKFLKARGIFKPIDLENMEVPVDNHLVRIAYRTGLVDVQGDLWRKIYLSEEVTQAEDTLLRLAVRQAYKLVALESKIDVGLIDDYLWNAGRTICTREREPECSKCPFNSFCRAFKEPGKYMVSEHKYLDTWYY